MKITTSAKVVVVTGTVWTGSKSAPRKLLVQDGFVRPIWFTTGRKVTDADYKTISEGSYHLALSEGNVLASISYGGAHVGILLDQFLAAAEESSQGVLIVGPPDIAEQVAENIPQTKVFALKDSSMECSDHLAEANRRGQLERIDVNLLDAKAWSLVHDIMLDKLGLPPVEKLEF